MSTIEQRIKAVLHDAGISRLRGNSSVGRHRLALIDGLIDVKDRDLAGADIHVRMDSLEQPCPLSAHAMRWCMNNGWCAFTPLVRGLF